MSLPTKSDLQSMDYTWLEGPFVRIVGDDTMNTLGMDYIWMEGPFVVVAVTPAAASQIKSVNGVLTAGVGKVFGLAMASVKKVIGVSNV